jgi:hypothetical protein
MRSASCIVLVLFAWFAGSGAAMAQTGTVTAAWDRSYHPDHAGYVLSYGPAPGVYTTTIDVGDVTTYQVTVPVGVTFYFRVRSYRHNGVMSADSNVATGGAFTDAELVQGVTPVKAAHFTDLRTRIDAQRLARGLVAYPWSSGVASGMPIRAQHVIEMQTALTEAYDRADVAPPAYAPVAPGGLIRARDITDLRAAVVALEASYP